MDALLQWIEISAYIFIAGIIATRFKDEDMRMFVLTIALIIGLVWIMIAAKKDNHTNCYPDFPCDGPEVQLSE